ncbi:MAG: hydrogenase maturation protease [Coriobacteriales bacterium]|nr:hydrogenase maturation protease [Coriobacteriales bacterium]
MTGKLVVCIGNVARGDDGVAHTVASMLADGECAIDASIAADLEVLAVHALDIALAERIAAASTVIVVDAARRSEPAVDVERVAPTPAETGEHGSTPGALLALADALYGASPAMWLVSVAAPEMPHRVGLSRTAAQAAEAACACVSDLLS